jgi:hypothetical protein
MKKIIAIILTLALLFSFTVIANAAKTDNLVDATNAGFENVTDVKSTKWYRLTDGKGNSVANDSLYTNISIKSNGGYTGSNYISMTSTASWHSPSINIYPFIKSAGAGTYVISFRYRSSAQYAIKQICVRGLKDDITKKTDLDFSIQSQSDNNIYFYLTGSTSAEADNGWYLFTSRAFAIDASQLDGDHNWWFSVDNTPAKEGAPLTLDIDDFTIAEADTAAATTPSPTKEPSNTAKPGSTITEVVVNEDSIVSEKDSTFESATDVKSTNWYKLTDAYGSSRNSPNMYTGVSIGTDGGHTGKKYISMSLSQSWHSPSINIHPILKAAGENTYVLSFWYRANIDFNINAFLLRGLASDAYEEAEYDISILPKGSGNQYATIEGSTISMKDSDWKCFYSEPFEFAAEQMATDYNWWFCLDQLKASSDKPLILDIDDFIIVPEESFEEPEDPNDIEISTDIAYLTDELIKNAFPKFSLNSGTSAPGATLAPGTTPAPSLDSTTNTNNGGSGESNVAVTVIITVAVFAVTLAGSFVVVKLVKKKKQ